ncbi:MAG: hypothetical protein FJW88_14415 [Actinobacteria bacterium]|nr:hypothetical protein [Actinomycetota bacterium]
MSATVTGSRAVVESLLGLDRGSRSGYRWLNLHRSSLLLPTGAPRAAACALERRSARTPAWSIAGRRVISATLRGLATLDRRPAPPATSPIMQWIATELDRSDLAVVALLGPPRPNDKPVLQVVDHAGTTLAWAKIGWSPLTCRLVEHETRVLADLRPLDPRLRVPTPIAATTIDGCSIALHSALPVWEGSHQGVEPDVVWLTRAIAETGSTSTAMVGESAYFAHLCERVARVEPAPARDTVTRVTDGILAAVGDVPVHCGRFHGDLSPWNLDWQTEGVLVWDWERSEDELPVGLDTVHFSVQEHVGAPLADVARTAATTYTTAVGQDPRLAVLLERAYPLEIFLRREEEQREASAGADPAAVATLLTHLEQFA